MYQSSISCKYQNHVPLDLIDLPSALRRHLPKPDPRLVSAISERGPEAVPPLELAYFLHTGRYELLGRPEVWVAAQRAGQMDLPAVVYEQPNRMWCDAKLKVSLQASASPIEIAEGLWAFWVSTGREMSKAQIAERFGMNRATVSHYMRLLSLPDPIKDMMRKGLLGAGQAKPLCGLPEREQVRLASHAVKHRTPARKVEAIAKKLKSPLTAEMAPGKAADTIRLEKVLSESLGAPVELEGGSLRIVFGENLEVLDGLVERLGLSDAI